MMKKIFFKLVIHYILMIALSLNACARELPNKTSREDKAYDLLSADKQLEDELKRKIKPKVDELLENKLSNAEIEKKQKETREEFNREQEKKDKEFNQKYHSLLNDLYRLEKIKCRVNDSHKLLSGLSGKILDLYTLLRWEKNTREIYQYQLKQRLKPIPAYFLLLGNRTVREVSGNDPAEYMINSMTDYLAKHKFSLEFKAQRGGSEITPWKLGIRKHAIFPDTREFFKQGKGVVYSCKILTYYPFHTIEKSDENDLEPLFEEFFKVDNPVEILGFKFTPRENRAERIEYVDFNSHPKDAPDTIMDFFGYNRNERKELKGEYEQLIADLEQADRKNVRKINRLLNEYREKSASIEKDINGNKNKLSEYWDILNADNDEFKKGIGDLTQLAKEMQPGRDFIEKIQETERKVKDIINKINENHERDESFQKEWESINTGFSGIISMVEELKKKGHEQVSQLISRREFEFLGVGQAREISNNDGNEVFMEAAHNALDNIKEQIMTAGLDIIRMDKNGNFGYVPAREFYRKGKIKDLAVPLIYRIAPGTTGRETRYIVYLKVKVVFDRKGFFRVSDYFETVEDKVNHLKWTKDVGNLLVYNGGAKNSAAFILNELNRRLKEEERRDNPWMIAGRNDLDKLLHQKELFKKLNIRLNVVYWTTEKVGQYYRTYIFRENPRGKLELIPDKNIPTDGAYCLFVRRYQ